MGVKINTVAHLSQLLLCAEITWRRVILI